jgi:hypothetical protein
MGRIVFLAGRVEWTAVYEWAKEALQCKLITVQKNSDWHFEGVFYKKETRSIQRPIREI